jgi:CxxC motif-containing protein (DUF1111 family)
MNSQTSDRQFVPGSFLLLIGCGAALAATACGGPIPPPGTGTTNINVTTNTPVVPGNGITPVLTAALAADPGPRAGDPGAGGPFPGLTDQEKSYFADALVTFKEVDSVSGTLPEETGKGLGPTFNGNACKQCHAQPDVGGSSPSPNSPQIQGRLENPQVMVASLDGATNALPDFIKADGPVREARFKSDGGVHGLFTIAGRTDAPGCTLAQPDFVAAELAGNLIFRTPTPVFGLGLVEDTPDSTLQANLDSDLARKRSLGISGVFNTSGNDGTITRFGWKAQNKSLLIFAGEAYNVEQGVTNELFGNPRSNDPACLFNLDPEDGTDPSPVPGATTNEFSGDVVQFAMFMRLSAPPTPGPTSDSINSGATLFDSAGCTACHSPTLTTGQSRYGGMSGFVYHPYSDIALHHMGTGLADGISQGGAGPDQFRTAPLWGVGQRLFFLHDGRTSDLGEAIEAHASVGSEANVVIQNFNALSAAQQGDILAFLRSL